MAARIRTPTVGDMETTLMDNQVPVDGATNRGENRNRVRRGSLFWTAVLAALGSAATYLAPLPAVLHESIPFGMVFVLLGIAQLATVGAVVAKPTVRNLVQAGCAAGAVVVFWAVKWLGLVTPDPWQPVDTVIGFTDRIAAASAALAGILFAALAARGARPGPSVRSRVLVGLASAPLALSVALAVVVGVLAATDGFTGAGFPTATVPPRHLPAGQLSTVEYCRPDGVSLAMDLYTPPATANRPAPVALYVHGGGLVLGDRETTGLGANLADQAGALFTPLQRQLNAHGFLVASIDYRPPPESAWPAQIQDAKCAVRFLRANAVGLNIDPTRIGVWGSSAGGLLVSLLGVTGTDSTFDTGQYAGQSSAVGAVVDMFGPADLTDLHGSDLLIRAMLAIGLGTDRQTRLSASPVTHIHPGAPPFLILQGTRDTDMLIRQSQTLTDRLHAAHDPATLITVQGAGHSLVTPGQSPTPEQLTKTVIDFLASTLSGGHP